MRDFWEWYASKSNCIHSHLTCTWMTSVGLKVMHRIHNSPSHTDSLLRPNQEPKSPQHAIPLHQVSCNTHDSHWPNLCWIQWSGVLCILCANGKHGPYSLISQHESCLRAPTESVTHIHHEPDTILEHGIGQRLPLCPLIPATHLEYFSHADQRVPPPLIDVSHTHKNIQAHYGSFTDTFETQHSHNTHLHEFSDKPTLANLTISSSKPPRSTSSKQHALWSRLRSQHDTKAFIAAHTNSSSMFRQYPYRRLVKMFVRPALI